MLRPWMFVVVLALGACGGKDKVDRAKVDAILHKVDACTDVACAEAAAKEFDEIFKKQLNSDKGTAPEDTEYLLTSNKVIKDKIARLQGGAK